VFAKTSLTSVVESVAIPFAQVTHPVLFGRMSPEFRSSEGARLEIPVGAVWSNGVGATLNRDQV